VPWPARSISGPARDGRVGTASRRLRRDRGVVHGHRARHRHALGKVSWGAVLDVGCPPHLDGAAVRPLHRLPRSASHAGCGRRTGQTLGGRGPRAIIDVPIVHWAVDWWQGQHPQSTILHLHPKISGLMAFSLFLGFVAGLLSFAWLLNAPLPPRGDGRRFGSEVARPGHRDRQREGTVPTAGAAAR